MEKSSSERMVAIWLHSKLQISAKRMVKVFSRRSVIPLQYFSTQAASENPTQDGLG